MLSKSLYCVGVPYSPRAQWAASFEGRLHGDAPHPKTGMDPVTKDRTRHSSRGDRSRSSSLPFDDSSDSDFEVGEGKAGAPIIVNSSTWAPVGITVDMREGVALPDGVELVGASANPNFSEMDDGTLALFVPAVSRTRPAVAPPPEPALPNPCWSASLRLTLAAQASRLELKLKNISAYQLNDDKKLPTYSIMLAVRADKLPLPLFAGGPVVEGVETEQIQISKDGSISVPGRSVRTALRTRTHPLPAPAASPNLAPPSPPTHPPACRPATLHSRFPARASLPDDSRGYA